MRSAPNLDLAQRWEKFEIGSCVLALGLRFRDTPWVLPPLSNSLQSGVIFKAT